MVFDVDVRKLCNDWFAKFNHEKIPNKEGHLFVAKWLYDNGALIAKTSRFNITILLFSAKILIEKLNSRGHFISNPYEENTRISCSGYNYMVVDDGKRDVETVIREIEDEIEYRERHALSA